MFNMNPINKIRAGVPVIIISIFVSEYLTMNLIGDESAIRSLIDALIVTSVVAIEQYFFLVQPFKCILDKIKILKGFVSICSSCQHVNINGKWEHKTNFVIDTKQLSHGLCPTCAKESLEELRAAQNLFTKQGNTVVVGRRKSDTPETVQRDLKKIENKQEELQAGTETDIDTEGEVM